MWKPDPATNSAAALRCACGSGLTRPHCCEAPPAALIGLTAHQRLAPLEDEAEAALRGGLNDVAERLALDVLELAPGRLRALSILYEIRKTASPASGADALLSRIVTLDPNNFAAINEICLRNLRRGALAEAELHARNAVRIEPENAQAHYLMGMVLTESHRPAIGEYHYRRALQLAGTRSTDAICNLAWCLVLQGKIGPARALYAEALMATPDSLQALHGLAKLEEADRQLDAAEAAIETAERHHPNHPALLLLRATILGRRRQPEAALTVLGTIAQDAAAIGPDEWLTQGRLLDQAGRYEEAFRAYEAGKALLRDRTGVSYRADAAADLAARLEGFFTRRRLTTLPRVATGRRPTAQPIFILGFMRSGTTLAEQILTAHPAIAAGGELPFLHELTEILPRVFESPLAYPEALAELWMGDHRDDLNLLRDHYLRRAAQLGVLPPEPQGDKAWFTDKMPLNEMHLGLIHMIFPNSPLIMLTRHPLDVVLSVHANLMTHGYYCAYSLESAARHYALISDLLAHTMNEVDANILPIRYEDLVADPEREIRRMLTFIGLPFHPDCLCFETNARYARTASYAQVTEKLYTTSVARHRHYAAQLEPVRAILAPAMARLGYH